MRVVFNPRLWLFIWLGLGAAGLLYVILAASLSGGGDSAAGKPATTPIVHDPALLEGEMADFRYALPPRLTPAEPFLHDGEDITLTAFRGKAVLVNFWATWCAPCLKELPSLDALQRELGGDDFAVVAVAADPRGADVAAEFLKRLGIKHLARYADPHLRLASAVGGSAMLPISILYDAQGREIGRLVGEADWTSAEAKALVKRAIGE